MNGTVASANTGTAVRSEAATSGPSTAAAGSRTRRPASSPTAIASSEKPRPSAQSPRSQPVPSDAASPSVAPKPTVTTSGNVTSTTSSRRYCSEATTRASAPRSWAKAVSPAAPPAIDENVAVTRLAPCRSSSWPNRTLTMTEKHETSTTMNQSAPRSARFCQSTMAPTMTPTTAWPAVNDRSGRASGRLGRASA